MQTHEELRIALEKLSFFSVPDAAQLLNCDDRTLRKAISTGEIPATKIGSKWFVPTDWLKKQVKPL